MIMITQPRFGADQSDYESIRSPFAQYCNQQTRSSFMVLITYFAVI